MNPDRAWWWKYFNIAYQTEIFKYCGSEKNKAPLSILWAAVSTECVVVERDHNISAPDYSQLSVGFGSFGPICDE